METDPFRPYIVDVEASGFGSRSYPIEIGLALEPEHRYCTLIAPARDWIHWDPEAQKVHHIPRDTLLASGKPLAQVALELNRLLQEATVYTDGWAVDKPWITRLFAEAGLRPTFWVSPLERILTEPQMDIWHDTRKKVAAALHLNRHRASADAFIVQDTFMLTRELTGSSRTRSA